MFLNQKKKRKEKRKSYNLRGVDGVGIVGVRQQIDVELKRHVAHRGDLVLRGTPGVQEPRGGILQLLQSVETQTLHERSFNLSDRRKGGRQGSRRRREEKDKSHKIKMQEKDF